MIRDWLTRKTWRDLFLLAGTLTFGVCFALSSPHVQGQDASAPKPVEVKEKKDLVAEIETTMGKFKIRLFYEQVPKTVSNFMELVKADFYKGLTFHRVIPGFMVQTGDPEGTGQGGPGYTFKDEFHPDLRHDRKGMVSMANAGKDSNGSQFFITVGPAPHLDDRHAVFGEVIEGYDIVEKISKVESDGTKPKSEIKIVKVSISADWFKPVAFEKIKEMSEQEMNQLSEKVAKKIFEQLGATLDLGPLGEVTFVEARSRFGTMNISYGAAFAKAKDTKLLLLGRPSGKKFEVDRVQFIRE